MAACRRESSGALVCRLRVQARASASEFAGLFGDRLKVRIKAPPVDGAANDALLRFLAKAFAVPRSGVELLSGAGTRDKTVRIVSPRKIPDEIASHVA